MPDGDLLELNVTQQLYGVSRNTRFYFEQAGADEGGARDQLDAFIDSFEASPAFTNWQAMVSDDLTFICLGAKRVLPVTSMETLQFGNTPGTDVGEALPPNINAMITWYSIDTFTRKGRSRNWFMGINEERQTQGMINVSQFDSMIAFANALQQIDADYGGGVFFRHSVVTSRDPVTKAPLTFTQRSSREVRGRIKHLRNSTIRVCGAS